MLILHNTKGCVYSCVDGRRISRIQTKSKCPRTENKRQSNILNSSLIFIYIILYYIIIEYEILKIKQEQELKEIWKNRKNEGEQKKDAQIFKTINQKLTINQKVLNQQQKSKKKDDDSD